MKKIILVLGVSLIAAGCNVSQQTDQQGAAPVPSLQTYTYAPDHFEFQYSNDFSNTTPNYANLENKIVQIQLPASAYSNTNFGDAAFAVSSQATTSLQKCLALPGTENATAFKDQEQINGNTFYKSSGTGAGAGNLYETRVYRIWHNQTCIELTETLHTGNIGNYPAGEVTEVDHEQVFSRLDAVKNTFKFNE